MPRKKNEAAAPSFEVTPEQTSGIERAQEAANTMAALRAEYGQGRDFVNQLLGQVQMSRAISKFTDVVSLSKLKQIKENKLYRGAAGQKAFDMSGNEIADVGTWAGFCQALGVSASKIDEDISNLNAFGEDALQQLNSVGVGYRELRQFRKLPDDERIALIEAAKIGDKNELLDLAESLIAKHTKEKEDLSTQVEELAADNEAKDQVLSDKNRKLDELDKKLRRSKGVELIPWDERVGDLNGECSMIAVGIEELLEKFWVILQAITNAQFENDVQDRARAMLSKNYYDRTQRIVDRVAFIQGKLFEEFDGYINEPKYLMASPEDGSNEG